MAKLPQLIGQAAPPTRSVGVRKQPAPSGGGGGRSGTGLIQVDNEPQKWMAFISTLGVLANKLDMLAPQISTNTAVIIANMYKTYLQGGVGDKLSPLTLALIGGERPPLAALSRHVIVVPARGTKPAKVTFEKGWSKKAMALHVGYTMDMSTTEGNRVRGALLLAAGDMVGGTITDVLGENGSSQGIWIVPPRPHIDFLKRQEVKNVITYVYEHAIHGRPLPSAVKAAAHLRPPGIHITPFIPSPIVPSKDGIII